MIVNPKQKDRAEDILQELREVLAKHRCVLAQAEGQMVLARVTSVMPRQCEAIAVIVQISPDRIEYGEIRDQSTID